MKETNGRHGLKFTASFAMAAILAMSSVMSIPAFADADEPVTEIIAEAEDMDNTAVEAPAEEAENSDEVGKKETRAGISVGGGGGVIIDEEVTDWPGFSVTLYFSTGATFILAEKEDEKYEENCEEPNDGTKLGAIVVTTGMQEVKHDSWEGDKYPGIGNFKSVSFKVANSNEEVNYNIVEADGFTLQQNGDTYTITANNPPAREEDYKKGIVVGHLEYAGGYGEGEITASDVTFEVESGSPLSVDAIWNFQYNVEKPLPKATFILAERKDLPYSDEENNLNDGTVDGAIVVTSGSDDPLTNFTAASFKIDNDNPEVLYEIVAKEGYALLYHEETEMYEINVKPDEDPVDYETEAGDGIVIGYIQYQGGYGKGTITADAEYVRVTKEIADNLYTELEVSETWEFDYEVKEPTEELTVNVDFNLPVITENEADYQKMTLNVYSPKVGNVTIALGKDKPEVEIEYGEVAIEDFKAEDNKYTVVLTNLPANDTYTVSIKGDGYRSAKTSLNLNEAKTVLFWNNAKEEDAIHVKTNAGETEKMITKNFLAGDIIMDNKIDLYDLSAVSSYFGKGTGTAVEGSTENGIMTDYAAEDYADYVQYDLNRDGKVDIIDITMVIDGWAE